MGQKGEREGMRREGEERGRSWHGLNGKKGDREEGEGELIVIIFPRRETDIRKARPPQYLLSTNISIISVLH